VRKRTLVVAALATALAAGVALTIVRRTSQATSAGDPIEGLLAGHGRPDIPSS